MKNLLCIFFPVPKEESGLLNIMRCPFHMSIQSYINSDYLISRLFPLVAARSRGVAVSPQVVVGHTDLTKSDVWGCHLWETFLIRVCHTGSALVLSQVSSSIRRIVQAALWCFFVLVWRDIQDEVHRAGRHQGSAESLFLQGRGVSLWLPVLTSASPPSGKTLSKVKWVCDFLLVSAAVELVCL